MSQAYRYPESSQVTVAAVGQNDLPIPTSSILIGAENPSGDLRPLQVTASDELLVSVSTSVLPTGAATEAKQDDQITLATTLNSIVATEATLSSIDSTLTAQLDVALSTRASEATLSSIDGKLPATLGQKLMAASLAVVIASDQSSVDVDVVSSVLPTGAATEATLENIDATLTAQLDVALSTRASEATLINVSNALDVSLSTRASESTLSNVDSSLSNIDSKFDVDLSTRATEATLSSIDGKINSDYGASSGAVRTAAQIGNVSGVADFNDGASGAQTLRVSANIMRDGNDLSYNTGAADANSLRVVLANESKAQTGRSVVTTIRNDYSSVNVTTGAWVQLVASLGSTVNMIEIFDSSGQTLELGTGAGGAETRLILQFPGGNGQVPVTIASGTRVSIRAVSATASTGELDINFYS